MQHDQRVVQPARERQPLLVAGACPVRMTKTPGRKRAHTATADARIVGTIGEMVRAVPLRVVERPASLAASLGRPVLALGTERDPFDVAGLQQEFRVVLLLGHCHQALAQRLSIPMFGSGNMNMPEVPFGDELGPGIAGLLAKVASPGIDRHECFGGDAGDMGQGAAKSVLQRRLSPVALDAVRKAQQLRDRALEVRHGLPARGTRHG